MTSIRNFISLAKPGIIVGNLLTVAAGSCVAIYQALQQHSWHLQHILPTYWQLLLASLIGSALVIASGCVFNNYIDCDIDRLMQRTAKRVLACDLMHKKIALYYAFSLGILGFIVLKYYTNTITTLIALTGFSVYVILYSLLLKRHSKYATLIGSIAGAVPVLIGYCAIANILNITAILLFLFLAVWQMPHSYAIAIYRFDDYLKAKIPVLPVVIGIKQTKIHMLGYSLIFLWLTVCLVRVIAADSLLNQIVLITAAAIWGLIAIFGFFTTNNVLWARIMFFSSLVLILLFSLQQYLRTCLASFNL